MITSSAMTRTGYLPGSHSDDGIVALFQKDRLLVVFDVNRPARRQGGHVTAHPA
jgi:hypothetical protein